MDNLFSQLMSALVAFGTAYFVFRGKQSDSNSELLHEQVDFISKLKKDNEKLSDKVDLLNGKIQEIQNENFELKQMMLEMRALLKENQIKFKEKKHDTI